MPAVILTLNRSARFRRTSCRNLGQLLMNRTSDYEYVLPPELIAQSPVPRGESRLLVLERQSGQVAIERFSDLTRYLRDGDILVVNDTRVSARRFAARLPSGRPAEVLLMRRREDEVWEALVYPGRRMKPGMRIRLEITPGSHLDAEVVDRTPEGGRLLRIRGVEPNAELTRHGTIPLPPYIHVPLADEERYQTVYATRDGSAAAPTAGLHFTEDILAEAAKLGVQAAAVTLHVGVDTFRPIRSENPDEHSMHGEWYTIGQEAADIINNRRGRVVAVGTTVVRTLESAALSDGRVEPRCGVTRLFIRPGHSFRVVEAMVTNFHLPRSTLLMLVSAFAGRESVLNAYRRAVEARFRFYSFGDAMLIV